MKETIKYALVGVLLLPLLSCAPGAHVRVGIGAHTPGPWGGPYPYPEEAVVIGRPAGTDYYPHLDTGKTKTLSTAKPDQSGELQSR